MRMNVAVTERDGLADSAATNGSRDCLRSYTVIFEENRFPATGWAQASRPCVREDVPVLRANSDDWKPASPEESLL